MTLPHLARHHAQLYEGSDSMSLQECIEAACREAVEEDRKEDTRLTDDRLFIPVEKVKELVAAELAGIRAACNGDLRPGVSTEMLVRELYHDNADMKKQLGVSSEELERLALIDKLDPYFILDGRYAGEIRIVVAFRGDDHAAIRAAQNRILDVFGTKNPNIPKTTAEFTEAQKLAHTKELKLD